MVFKYIFKKIIFLLVSLFMVATLTFFLMKAIPGDPFIQEQGIHEEILASLYKHYGLDKPLFIQYIKYIKGLLLFDLGPSFKYEGRTVNQIICEGFPVSASLGAISLFFSVFFGTTIGVISSIYQGKWQDRLVMLIAVIGMSIPSFVMASLLQYLFSMKLSLFPIARWGSIWHAILPAIALSALPTAFIARLTRMNVIETLQQEYIITAMAKGLSVPQIIFRHVLKNSLLPVLTYLGPLTASILTGSFIIEKIFGIPGLGGWFVTSISNRDYTVIMGVTMFYSLILMLAVFIVDVLYFFIDPRIQKNYE
ncbi:MAG: ABC transporter permease [Chlamydiales bacterium]|nr:ABC transporter permease [Chlamydiales bacterium]